MELIGPTCVLPSSIPTTTDGLGLNIRGVLQERSVNRQDGPIYPPLDDVGPGCRHLDDSFDSRYDLDSKYEYTLPDHLQEQHAVPLYDHDIEHYVSGTDHGPLLVANCAALTVDEEARIQRLTHDICTRAMSYTTYANYRDNQRKRSANGSKGGEVWTDQEELAFWRGIVLYPPCGRKQQYYRSRPTKPMGRNELLAAVVQDSTGEIRGRKQVSSHLQVVRQKLAADPWLVAQLISSDDKKSRVQADRQDRISHRTHWKTKTVRRSERSSRHSHRQYQALPSDVLPLHLAVANPLSVARFDLFIRSSHETNPLKRSITRMSPEHHNPQFSAPQQPDQNIDFTSAQVRCFPDLEAHWQDGTLQDTQVIFANVSLDLDNLQSLDLRGAEIGIDYHLKPDPTWDTRNFKSLECTTTFFEGGHAVDSDAAGKLLSEDSNHGTLVAPFSSEFWVRKILGIMSDLQRARDERKRAVQMGLSTQAAANAERLAKKWEFDASDKVQRLTAVQGFVGSLANEPKRKRRLLTVCWTFEQTVNGRDGEMVWWNGILPYAGEDVGYHQQGHDSSLLGHDHIVHPDSTLSIQTHMTLPDLVDGECFSAPQSAGFIDDRGLHSSHHMPGFQGMGVLGIPDHVNIANDSHHDLYSPHPLEQNPMDFVGTDGALELCMDGAPPVLGSMGAGAMAATANMGFPQHDFNLPLTQPNAHHQRIYDQSWMQEQVQTPWDQPQHLPTQHHHVEHQEPSRPSSSQLQLSQPTPPQPYIGPYLAPSPFEDIPTSKHSDSFHALSGVHTPVHTPIVEVDLKLELSRSAPIAPMIMKIEGHDDEAEAQAGADASTGLSQDMSNLEVLSQEVI